MPPSFLLSFTVITGNTQFDNWTLLLALMVIEVVCPLSASVESGGLIF